MSELYHAAQLSLFNISIEHLDGACFCNGKPCTKCSRLLCVKHFNRGTHKDGLHSCCRQCQKSYYQSHAERERNRKRASYKAGTRKSSAKNRQDVKRWKQNHPEATIAEKSLRRARIRKVGGSFTAQEWKHLKAEYNHTCLCCGKQEPEIQLTPDHVVPLVKGGTNDIANIQPLCLSCNSSKREKVIDWRSKARRASEGAHEGVPGRDSLAVLSSNDTTDPHTNSTGGY